MTKFLRRFLSLAVAGCLVVSSASPVAAQVVIVRVDPAFGRHVGPVQIAMTTEEREIVRWMSRRVTGSAVVATPATARAARWFIEPSAEVSRTLALSRVALTQLQLLLESLGLTRMARTNIVVARTQSFINESLAALDCHPDLSRTNGIHLMGASLCDRSVIVINLTGYFFLRSIKDALTTEMESRTEPRLSSVDYRIVDRNLSGLSHEWAHIARASATEGLVPDDEPVWMSEGFAEVMAGISRARAFPVRYSYVDFHVIRLRKFADWRFRCSSPISEYRSYSRFLGGCEYYVGPMAVEYLIARLGGLPKLVELFHVSSDLMSFSRAFRRVYGMNIEKFERMIDAYLASIRALPEFS